MSGHDLCLCASLPALKITIPQIEDAVAHIDGEGDAFAELVSMAVAKDPALQRQPKKAKAAAASSAGMHTDLRALHKGMMNGFRRTHIFTNWLFFDLDCPSFLICWPSVF